MNMKTLKILYPVISIVSVLVMFIWNYIEGSWQHCWLAVFAGGIIITILSLVFGAKKEDKKDSEK